jgi:hypothetical protein
MNSGGVSDIIDEVNCELEMGSAEVSLGKVCVPFETSNANLKLFVRGFYS